MKIIPVIDILGSLAVHAVRGERNQYKPLKGVLCASSDPLDVASTFKKLGFAELYTADLDAILENQPNLGLIKQITESTGLKLMVDAGVTDLKRAKALLANHASQIIIGTETLRSTAFVEEAVRSLGSDCVVVSLDLKNSLVLGHFATNLPEPLDLLKEFQKMGVAQVIVLDLARVGSHEGVDVPFLKTVLESLDLEVFVGGGVRNLADLKELETLGVSGVLLATALHSGKLTIDELKHVELGLKWAV